MKEKIENIRTLLGETSEDIEQAPNNEQAQEVMELIEGLLDELELITDRIC